MPISRPGTGDGHRRVTHQGGTAEPVAPVSADPASMQLSCTVVAESRGLMAMDSARECIHVRPRTLCLGMGSEAYLWANALRHGTRWTNALRHGLQPMEKGENVQALCRSSRRFFGADWRALWRRGRYPHAARQRPQRLYGALDRAW